MSFIPERQVYLHQVFVYDRSFCPEAKLLHRFTTQSQCISQVWELLAHIPRDYHIEVESRRLVPWHKSVWTWWNRKDQANHPMTARIFGPAQFPE